VLLAGFAAWLSVARIWPAFRFAALVLCLIVTVLSWTLPPLTGEAAWVLNPSQLSGALPTDQ
jgi:hypothetical protein